MARRRNVGIAAAVGVVAAAMAVAGLVLAGLGPWDEPSTLIVGDSVTNLSRVEVGATTGAKIDADNGHTWAQMAPKVRGALAVMKADGGAPDRVGVLLGYNDVLKHQQDLGATSAVLDEFSDVPCVVVLKLPNLYGEDEATYNDQVQAIVDELPNTHADDGWAKVINKNLDEDATMLEADLVHPKTAEARQALADSFQRAFDRLC